MNDRESDSSVLGNENARRPPAPIARGRITPPVACRACGYNLFGLNVNSHCPECGTPIQRSLRGPLLRFSHPDWVRRLAHGTVWIVVAVIGSLVVGCFGSAMLRNSNLGVSEEWFGIMISVLASAVMLVGVWMVTSPERTEQHLGRLIIATRWLARLAPVASMAGSIVDFAPFFGAGVSVGVQICGFLLTFVSIVGRLALLVYALHLARRLPPSSLCSHTKIVLWGWGVTFSLVIVVTFLFLFMMIIGSPPFASNAPGAASTGFLVAVAIPGSCVAAIASLFFAIWSIILLIRYQSQIGEEYRLARSHWGKNESTTTG